MEDAERSRELELIRRQEAEVRRQKLHEKKFRCQAGEEKEALELIHENERRCQVEEQQQQRRQQAQHLRGT
jgi:hypothetical protein